MDFWVVVGAAAAGYIAKYWQNISRDRDSLSKLSSKGSNFEKPELPSCPFRRLTRRKKLDKDVSMDERKVAEERYADPCEQVGGSAVEVASANEFNGEKLESLGNYDDCNLLSLSSLSPGFLPSENLKGNECESGLSGDTGDNLSNPMGSVHIYARNKSSLRTKSSYRHFVKPLNSLESCLMAQLYQNHAKTEEYVLNSLPSPIPPTIRPLFVTDGSQIISRASAELHNARMSNDDYKLYKEVCFRKNENLLGVPPLPQIGSLDFPKKMKFKSGKLWVGRLRSSGKFGDGSLFHSQGGMFSYLCICLSV